ncbi:MAG: phosphoenolpyruvate--protein phosphotransferase [Lachnospiraceae bacterium]|nr:phosphoenolpyruvate--protein phosphotransferase [Lachnospiraceae bacterium]
MKILQGINVSDGVAINKLVFFRSKDIDIKKELSSDSEKELERFEDARKQLKNWLLVYGKQVCDLEMSAVEEMAYTQEFARAVQPVQDEDAEAIIQAYGRLLEDMEYISAIHYAIRNEGVVAEYAVWETSRKIAAMFEEMADAGIRESGKDILALSRHLIEILRDEKEVAEEETEGILTAQELSPAETIHLDFTKIDAFVTENGSVNSHSAILARKLGVPAVTGIPMKELVEYRERNATVIVDGFCGLLIIEPTKEKIAEYEEMKQRIEEHALELEKYKERKNETLDGTQIQLYANIESLKDMDAVLEYDADGVGLFRTEYLYMEGETYPSEEIQFQAYKAAAQALRGRKLIIRTMDIGADKQVAYMDLGEEENPAMGLRGIRVSLREKEIFKVQLRAILRASLYGEIGVMFPMITSMEEVCEIKQILAGLKKEMDAEAIAYKEPAVGVMIETPAAAMIADELAEEVDFISIGTNDLAQYVLATDRQNTKVCKYYNPKHKAVLRMISYVVEQGSKHNCPVSICGELARDTKMTEELLRMGVKSLSVATSAILPVRERICNIRLS